MTSYLKRMPVGVPGAISRPHNLTAEPVMLKSAAAFPAYGLAGKYDGDHFVPLEAGDVVDKIAGFYIRPYPTTSTPDMIRQVGPDKNFPGDALKRGYMTVQVGTDASAIAKGSAVYIRVASPTADSPLGSCVGAADGANTVLLPNAYFVGKGDATGVTELAYKI